MNAIELSLFSSRISAICEEMGAVLQRSAFSPNIKDRLDFSCAVFDANGELCAQAAHIPVHLGSMAYAMRDIVSQVEWQVGDMLILNDPFLGGTHLPDVTVITPVFVDNQLMAFIANRAHHADIGASSPGSMPVSHTLEEEGMVIPPSKLLRHGKLDEPFMQALLDNVSNPLQSQGDFTAQISANQLGVTRLQALIEATEASRFTSALMELNDYAQRLADSALSSIPEGEYRFTDYMDDDGAEQQQIPVTVCITVRSGSISVDFAGTAPQVKGNINCSLSVAAAAVYYVFRCLMPANTPACEGSFRAIKISAPEGCLLNAKRPAAVAAGNVETSTRVVDVIMGALVQVIPESMAAASHGSMNNVAMGHRGAKNWDYYETIGGGMGASMKASGLSARQTHMTNTLNTPVESLESHYPIRISRYEIRKDSGGEGFHKGGDGIIREYEFLEETQVTLLTERRTNQPWGMANGKPGEAGENLLNGNALPPKICFAVKQGDKLTIKTPGGGGYTPDNSVT
ncbi:MAG: hydantoinase B/oxoprolinase family protein [Gammaproteobacteria bacterium]|nr:hydantoinase B/oxoprolinase family protein [Gammaproteobacteria bacterium]